MRAFTWCRAAVLAAAAMACTDSTEPSTERPEAAAEVRPMVTALSFSQISGGEYHSCGRTLTGNKLYCWGDNYYGQLGNGTRNSKKRPTPVSSTLLFSWVSAGPSHTCAIATNAKAYCWGSNSDGQLGDGTTTDRWSPKLVGGGYSWKQIEVGGFSAYSGFTCGLTTGGRIYCWGSNSYGQLGNGGTSYYATPWPSEVTDVGVTYRQLAAGGGHTCAVSTTNTAYCWGEADNGQTGTGGIYYVPTAVSGGLAFRQVSAGMNHTCGTTTGSKAYCWGYGSYGALGNGTTYNRFAPRAVSGTRSYSRVFASAYHTCGLTTARQAYCWARTKPPLFFITLVGHDGSRGLLSGAERAEHTDRPLRGIRERMTHERIVTGLLQTHLEDRASAHRHIHRLHPYQRRGRRAVLEHSLEDAPDDVEGADAVRARIHYVKPQQLVRPNVERVRGILIGPAVEDDVIRCQPQESLPRQPSRAVRAFGVQVELALDQHELLRLRPRARRIDDERPVHPIRDVHGHGGGPAVVHERTRDSGYEPVVKRITRHDVHVHAAWGDLGGVEVHRMRDVRSIDQCENHSVTLADPESRTRYAAAERPCSVRNAGRDLHRGVGHVQTDSVNALRLGRGKHRPHGSWHVGRSANGGFTVRNVSGWRGVRHFFRTCRRRGGGALRLRLAAVAGTGRVAAARKENSDGRSGEDYSRHMEPLSRCWADPDFTPWPLPAFSRCRWTGRGGHAARHRYSMYCRLLLPRFASTWIRGSPFRKTLLAAQSPTQPGGGVRSDQLSLLGS
jgi:hypothetical protein